VEGRKEERKKAIRNEGNAQRQNHIEEERYFGYE